MHPQKVYTEFSACPEHRKFGEQYAINQTPAPNPVFFFSHLNIFLSACAFGALLKNTLQDKALSLTARLLYKHLNWCFRINTNSSDFGTWLKLFL